MDNRTGDCREVISSSIERGYSIRMIHDAPCNDSYLAHELHQNQDVMLAFVERYAVLLQTKDMEVAAVTLAGWFAEVAFATHYTLSAYNRVLKVELSNASYSIQTEQSKFPVILCEIQKWSVGDNAIEDCARSERMVEVLAYAYGQLLTPLLNMLSQVSGVSVRDLWGQVLAALYHEYQSWTQDTNIAQVRQHIEDDYNAVVNSLQSSTFQLTSNPFNRPLRFVESMEGNGQVVLQKPSCCLYYRLKEGVYCYTCPRISERKRSEMRKAYQDEQTK
ncbi:(2Fe-2S)-binding protein [Paenibacillus sp. strain BS8-2]